MLKKISLFIVYGLFSITLFAQWQSVGEQGLSGIKPDIVIDATGKVYMAYQDAGSSRKARVRTYNGSKWVEVGTSVSDENIVFGRVIDRPYLAIHPTTNEVYACYQKALSNGISVKRFNGTAWELIGSEDFVSSALFTSRTSMAIDASGRIYVAYAEKGPDPTSSGMTVQWFDGTDWVPLGSPRFSEGNPKGQIYTHNDELYVLARSGATDKISLYYFDGTDWILQGNQISDAAPLEGTFSAAINCQGIPHVAYYDETRDSEIVVKALINSTWQELGTIVSDNLEDDPSHLNNDANYVSLSIDEDDQVYVAYSHLGKVYTRKFVEGAWIPIGGENGFTEGDPVNAPDITAQLAIYNHVTYVVYEQRVVPSGLRVMRFETNDTDTTAPVFENSTPQISSIAFQGFDLLVDLDEPSTAYYIVVPNNSDAPSSSQVVAGVDYGTVEVLDAGTVTLNSDNFTHSFMITGLNPATAYEVYVIAHDDELIPNIQVSPVQLSVSLGTLLPVTILDFEATRSEQLVLLNWIAPSEEGNSGFDIELSEDGVLFRKIDFVKSLGNSREITKYEFELNNPKAAYYRLKQVGLDGSFSYSQIRFVAAGEQIGSISLYPNPANDKVYLKVENLASESFLLNLVDAQGRRLLEMATEDLEVLEQALNHKLSTIPNGSYLVVIFSEGKAFSQVLTLLR